MKTINPRLAIGLVLLQIQLLPLPAGAQDRQIRNLEGFNAIEVGSGIDLRIQQGVDFFVEFAVSDGELADIITEVNGGALQIRRERNTSRRFNWFDNYSVRVTLPVLESVIASGGSDVKVEGTISGDRLKLSISGGSDMIIEVAVDDLDIDTSGGSDVTLIGTTKSLRAEASGGSDLNGRRLTADEAYLQSSGGSDISITVLDRIVATASGGSDISYQGSPDIVDINADRSADVERR